MVFSLNHCGAQFLTPILLLLLLFVSWSFHSNEQFNSISASSAIVPDAGRRARAYSNYKDDPMI